MHNGRKLSRFQASRCTGREFDFHFQHGVHELRYRHVLVSTSLNSADRAALLLGFELALLHQARLTLLHVLPRVKQHGIAHGLDAIALLHAAADELQETPAAAMPGKVVRPRLHAFVDEIVPQGLQSAVNWRGERRTGQVAETIVSYVNESAADLVILSAKKFGWWLPSVHFDEWTIERRTRANVILIRGQGRFLSS